MNIEPNRTLFMGQRAPSSNSPSHYKSTLNLTQKIEAAENSKSFLEKTFTHIRTASQETKTFLLGTSSKIGDFIIYVVCDAKGFYSSFTDYYEWKELSHQLFDKAYLFYNKNFDTIGISESKEVLDFEKCYFPYGNNTRNKIASFFRDNGIPLLVLLSSLIGLAEFSHLANKSWKRGDYKTSACYFSFAILTGSVGVSILSKSRYALYFSKN